MLLQHISVAIMALDEDGDGKLNLQEFIKFGKEILFECQHEDFN